MKTLQKFQYAAAGLLICGVIAVLLLGPALDSGLLDNTVLENVILEEKDGGMEGYIYNLNAEERLYVLSNALNNRILPQSDYYATIRPPGSLSNIQTQSYAFQTVYRESEYNSTTRANAAAALQEELSELTRRGILPEFEFEPGDQYEIGLFTAIDVLEPKRSVTVWQFTFSGILIRDGLVDCVMDAQTHKIYSVSLRGGQSWDQYDADDIVQRWADYLETGEPEPFVPSSPLTEDATYYQKYAISGMEGDKTIVTVGFYDGIGEFFIKISR